MSELSADTRMAGIKYYFLAQIICKSSDRVSTSATFCRYNMRQTSQFSKLSTRILVAKFLDMRVPF